MALAQPIPSVPPVHLFTRPSASIHVMEKPPPLTPPPVAPAIFPSSNNLELTSPGATETYRVHSGQLLLVPPPPPRPDNLLNNLADRAFEQDYIPLKKVVVTGSLVTAINRKNPLKLIHPLVFAIGW